MCLIDDDRKLPVAMLIADVIEDERELLDGRDNDLLAAFYELAKLCGALRNSPDSCLDLCELLDRFADLIVKDTSVGHNDNRGEQLGIVCLEPDELVGEPSDRVR